MFAALIIVPLLLAADTDPKAELAKLQGEWILVSGVVDGKAVPEEQAKKGRLTYVKDQATLLTPHQSADPIVATLTLQPAGKGGTMEFVREKGPSKGVKILSRYEWNGPDSYMIIFDPTGKARPETMESKPGSGHILHVWKRAKSKE